MVLAPNGDVLNFRRKNEAENKAIIGPVWHVQDGIGSSQYCDEDHPGDSGDAYSNKTWHDYAHGDPPAEKLRSVEIDEDKEQR